MCLVCRDYKKGLISAEEAIQNISEIEDSLEEEHFIEVMDMLESDLAKKDLELDTEKEDYFSHSTMREIEEMEDDYSLDDVYPYEEDERYDD